MRYDASKLVKMMMEKLLITHTPPGVGCFNISTSLFKFELKKAV
jgi:hypothetical protein